MLAATPPSFGAPASRPALRKRLPAEDPKIGPTVSVEPHSLPLEPQALRDVASTQRAQTDSALGVDHPVPRDSALLRHGMEGIADLARVTSEAG
jgi:hypothetical protein